MLGHDELNADLLHAFLATGVHHGVFGFAKCSRLMNNYLDQCTAVRSHVTFAAHQRSGW